MSEKALREFGKSKAEQLILDWMKADGFSLLACKYPFDEVAQKPYLHHAEQLTSATLQLQNCLANSELLANWNTKEDRPTATGLYFNIVINCYSAY